MKHVEIFVRHLLGRDSQDILFFADLFEASFKVSLVENLYSPIAPSFNLTSQQSVFFMRPRSYPKQTTHFSDVFMIAISEFNHGKNLVPAYSCIYI